VSRECSGEGGMHRGRGECTPERGVHTHSERGEGGAQRKRRRGRASEEGRENSAVA
jgi:hypothetical protein